MACIRQDKRLLSLGQRNGYRSGTLPEMRWTFNFGGQQKVHDDGRLSTENKKRSDRDPLWQLHGRWISMASVM
jgi:hypothetical protein